MKKLNTQKMILLNNLVYESTFKSDKQIDELIYQNLHDNICQYWSDKLKHMQNQHDYNKNNIFKCLNLICDTNAMSYYITKMNHTFGQKYHEQLPPTSSVAGMPMFI